MERIRNTLMILVAMQILVIGSLNLDSLEASKKSILLEVDPDLKKEIEGLKSPSAEIRVKSALALSEISKRSGSTIPFLIEMLSDSTEVERNGEYGFHLWERPVIKVWEAAVDALSKIGIPAIEPLYLRLIQDDGIKKPQVACALGAINDQEATKFLIKALKNPQSFVRVSALSGFFNDKALHAVNEIIKLLKDKDAEVRACAAQTLIWASHPNKQETPDLPMNIPKPVFQSTSGSPLNRLIDKRALKPLIEALNDPDPKVRSSVAITLGCTKDSVVIQPLQNALKDPEIIVRNSAIIALGNIGNPNVISSLLLIISDKESVLRYNVASALSHYDDPRIIDSFILLLNDEDPDMRYFAASALSNYENYENQTKLINIFLLLLHNADPRIRSTAAFFLRGKKDSRVGEALFEALKKFNNSNAEDQLSLMAALSFRRDQRVLDYLFKNLNDDNPNVRKDIAIYLCYFPNINVLNRVIESLKDKNPWVRRNAARSLIFMKLQIESKQSFFKINTEKLSMEEYNIGINFGENYDKWKNWVKNLIN